MEDLPQRLNMMKRCNSIIAFCIFLCASPLAVSGPTLISETVPVLDRGLVVEFLTNGQEGEKAGIQPGDVLLRWSSRDESGEIESPFDLGYLRIDQGLRGRVKIEGRRGSQPRTWSLAADSWGIWVHPNFQGDLLSAYRDLLSLAEACELAQAVERWRRLAALVEKSGIRWLNPWFLSHAAQIASRRRCWEGYDDAYRESIKKASSASPVVKAELIRQWAGGYYERGDWTNAEQHYDEALTEWRKSGADTMAVSSGLSNVGVVAIQRGNFTKAQQYFRESLSITERLAPVSSLTVSDLVDLGFLSQQFGDLVAAEDYFRRALAIEQEISPSSANLALTLHNLGWVVGRRGDLAKAEDYFRRALAVAEKPGPDSQYLPEVLSSLAECVLDRGKPERAEEYEQRALAIREKQGRGIDVAFSFRNLGKIAMVRGNLAKADEYYQRALEIGEKISPLPPATTRFLIGLGYVARKRGDFGKAEEYFRRALVIMENLTPGSLDHAETLADLAGALHDQDQLDSAAQLYLQALSELEVKTAGLGGVDEDRSRYRAQHDRYRREYVDVLMAQRKPEIAFHVLEGSRGRTLLETLSRDQVDIRDGVNASLLNRERDLRQSLNAKTQYRIRLLNGEHVGAQLAAVDAEVAELLDRYQQVEAEIRAKSPKYAALTQPQPLSIKEIQQLLDPETTLLEYSLGEERSFVWVVGQNSLSAYELPKRSEIESVSRRAYQLLTARNSHGPKGETETETEARWAKADADYFKTATNLSRIVLGPVAGLLQGKRLLIVSDGALQYIPFSALPTPDKPQIPLILEHEIVNLPSASVVAELRRTALGRKEAPKAVAVLADPVFDLSDERLRKKIEVPTKDQSARLGSWSKDSLSAERLTRSVADVGLSRGGQFHLTRLLYSRQEAEAIMAVTPAGKGMKVLDFNANRAAATSAELAQYRIVHFATHGLLDNKHPELSGLVFSMVNRQGKPQDGFLQLADIYNLNLPVELVVLSACETGLGEEISGEGLIGLTRGFMYAGASRVVASLWNVSDVGTSELMARFYKAMEQDKLRPAAGLRAAQIQMWKQRQWRSPYYWAAFQLQGEWR